MLDRLPGMTCITSSDTFFASKTVAFCWSVLENCSCTVSTILSFCCGSCVMVQNVTCCRSSGEAVCSHSLTHFSTSGVANSSLRAEPVHSIAHLGITASIYEVCPVQPSKILEAKSTIEEATRQQIPDCSASKLCNTTQAVTNHHFQHGYW